MAPLLIVGVEDQVGKLAKRAVLPCADFDVEEFGRHRGLA
jgi:hypothetical protein